MATTAPTVNIPNTVNFMKSLNSMAVADLPNVIAAVDNIKNDATITTGPLANVKAAASEIEAGLKLFQMFAELFPAN